MSDGKTTVTVIIPAYNEENYIAKCLESVLGQTWPKDDLEILVVDGGSRDRTREILDGYAKRHPFIRVLDNPRKVVPVSLNIGILESKGVVIVRMDSHTVYAEDYLEKCVETLRQTDADNVGGPIFTLPGSDTTLARAIALATSHAFGVGNSKFRISDRAQYVDTVPFGAFRRELFGRVGMFNEKLVRNQDIEFNWRIRRAGGKIFLTPKIRSSYYNQSTLRGLWRQNFNNGFWNIFMNRYTDAVLSARHYVPMFFVGSLGAGVAAGAFGLPYGRQFLTACVATYTLASTVAAIDICRKSGARFFPHLIAVFAVLHLSYGTGSMWAFLERIIRSATNGKT